MAQMMTRLRYSSNAASQASRGVGISGAVAATSAPSGVRRRPARQRLLSAGLMCRNASPRLGPLTRRTLSGPAGSALHWRCLNQKGRIGCTASVLLLGGFQLADLQRDALHGRGRVLDVLGDR